MSNITHVDVTFVGYVKHADIKKIRAFYFLNIKNTISHALLFSILNFILGPTLFQLYINDLLDDFICNIAIYVDDTTLYSKCNQASDLWQQLELALTLI